ncbi:MAG: 50S ribosome-binding GTPase [Candidatus Desulfofervidaceae bacterium]|nr:50S ribosome-binding GTPase [Candidatus Desulfofervidaceae bacterium]
MPANLPPQYFIAERKYRAAKSPQEKIAALEEILMIMPKHKGTDKLRAALRRKLSQLKNTLEAARKKGKRGLSYYIEKEGAGQVAIVGLPNVGKSALLAKVTKAEPEVADYPFTTRVPMPGMMHYEDVQIQLVDLPALSEEYIEPWVGDILKRADLLLIMLDLSEDPLSHWEKILNLLGKFKIAIAGLDKEVPYGWMVKKTVVVANKLDVEDGEEILEIFQGLWKPKLPFVAISVKKAINLHLLAQRLYEALEVIRIYAKAPGKKPDLERPFIVKKGKTVLDFAEKVHKDIAAKLKFARIWNEKLKGLRVERDYILQDKDIVELRT